MVMGGDEDGSEDSDTEGSCRAFSWAEWMCCSLSSSARSCVCEVDRLLLLLLLPPPLRSACLPQIGMLLLAKIIERALSVSLARGARTPRLSRPRRASSTSRSMASRRARLPSRLGSRGS